MKTLLKTLRHLERLQLSYKVELQKLRIADALIRLRSQRGLTQAALARKMRISQSFIEKLESAEAKNYDLKMLAELATALNSRLEVKFRPHRARAA